MTESDFEQKKDESDKRDANTCMALGAGVGVLGAVAAVAAGAVCPVCVIAD